MASPLDNPCLCSPGKGCIRQGLSTARKHKIEHMSTKKIGGLSPAPGDTTTQNQSTGDTGTGGTVAGPGTLPMPRLDDNGERIEGKPAPQFSLSEIKLLQGAVAHRVKWYQARKASAEKGTDSDKAEMVGAMIERLEALRGKLGNIAMG